MKCKKIISFILSLCIIMSTLASFTVVNAANFAERNLTNVAVNSNFNEPYDSNLWALSSTAEGSLLEIVDDTKDTSETNKNKVLRFNGTGNTKTASYINYRGASSSKKYYMSFKIRLADNYDDVNDGKDNLYVIPNQLYNTNYKDLTMPKITKGDWTVCSGVITPGTSTTCDGLIGLKVSSKQDNTSTYNVKKAIYEIDDFELCEITSDFMKISLPTGVSVVSGGFSCVEKGATSATYVNYVKKQTDVVLKYEGEDKVLASDNVTITKNGSEYSFKMINEDPGITLIDPPVEDYTNLVKNGDMEDNTIIDWSKGGYAVGAEITIEKESDTSENHVLRFDGTGIKDEDNKDADGNDKSMSYMANNTVLNSGGKYYYSYKIRLVEKPQDVDKVYAYNSLIYSIKPELSNDWVTRSGIMTPTASTPKFNFKIINTQTGSATDQESNVPNVIYELDDVVIYNMTDIYEVVLPENENITITKGAETLLCSTSDTTQVNKYFVKAGDTVEFEYTGVKTLAINGVNLTQNGDKYTFTMPNSNATISAILPAFTNLVENGDMEDETVIKWSEGSYAKGAEITIVADSANPNNKVLRFDGTKITNENNQDKAMSFMAYKDLLIEDKQYYYSYKIRVVGDDYETDLYSYNQNHTETNNVAKPKLTTEWSTRSGTFTAKATSYNFKIISDMDDMQTNVPNVIYELDDVVIYDLNDISKIYLPQNSTLTTGEKVKALPFTNSDLTEGTEYYAEKDAQVTFTYSGDKELVADDGVDLNSVGDGKYTFTMPAVDVAISEVKDFSLTMENNIPKITVATEGKEFVIIVARYGEFNELEDVYVAEGMKTNTPKESILLNTVAEFSEITDAEWVGMHIFVWNNLTDINPLCDVYTCNAQ